MGALMEAGEGMEGGARVVVPPLRVVVCCCCLLCCSGNQNALVIFTWCILRHSDHVKTLLIRIVNSDFWRCTSPADQNALVIFTWCILRQNASCKNN